MGGKSSVTFKNNLLAQHPRLLQSVITLAGFSNSSLRYLINSLPIETFPCEWTYFLTIHPPLHIQNWSSCSNSVQVHRIHQHESLTPCANIAMFQIRICSQRLMTLGSTGLNIHPTRAPHSGRTVSNDL